MTESNILENLQNSFEKEMKSGEFPKFKFTSVFGDPGTQVSSIAKERGAGLIGISSHWHTGFSRLLLGSVAERVVRLSPCPVLVFRGGDVAG
ncbi:MAG: universal stress protein [Mariniblastus sp.]